MGDLSHDEKRRLLELEIEGYSFYSYNKTCEGEITTPWGKVYSTGKLYALFDRKLKFGDREQIDLSDAVDFIELLTQRDFIL